MLISNLSVPAQRALAGFIENCFAMAESAAWSWPKMVLPGTFTAAADAPRATHRRMSEKHGPAERYAKTMPPQVLRNKQHDPARLSQGMYGCIVAASVS